MAKKRTLDDADRDLLHIKTITEDVHKELSLYNYKDGCVGSLFGFPCDKPYSISELAIQTLWETYIIRNSTSFNEGQSGTVLKWVPVCLSLGNWERGWSMVWNFVYAMAPHMSSFKQKVDMIKISPGVVACQFGMYIYKESKVDHIIAFLNSELNGLWETSVNGFICENKYAFKANSFIEIAMHMDQVKYDILMCTICRALQKKGPQHVKVYYKYTYNWLQSHPTKREAIFLKIPIMLI
jgi:hypothetical protein